ncbi:MAG: site-specific DNA-methyltransferase [Candidatus Brocadiaceae bacterium]|nr:site-specific DNA-methyltransferase [Candidatus Brocadiaceae bacterium]
MKLNSIICGNALDVLASWPDGCVDMAITSPPYWGLRAYDCPPQIWGGDKGCKHDWRKVYKPPLGGSNPPDRPANVGANRDLNDVDGVRGKGSYSDFCNKCGAWQGYLGLEPTYQLYIDHLMQIFTEVKRVVKDSGSFWVNISDSYAGSNYGRSDYRENKSLQKDIYNKPSPQSQASRFSKWRRDGEGGELGNCITQKGTPGIKAKSLVGIPERFVIAMTDDGWIRRNTIAWAKQILYQDNTTQGSCMPTSAEDRFNQSWEPLYFFTKNQKYYFDLDAVKVKLTDSGIQRLKYDFNSQKAGNYAGISNENCNKWAEKRKMSLEGKHPPTVWAINTIGFPGHHFAVYPEALLERPIKACCPPVGIVLDPFMGSGTTALAALSLGRKFVGIDASQKYVDMTRKRIEDKLPLLAQEGS